MGGFSARAVDGQALADVDRDGWTDPRVLAKANPNIGISVYQEYLESQQQRAIKSARFTNTFKTKHLNVWTSAKAGYSIWMTGRHAKAAR